MRHVGKRTGADFPKDVWTQISSNNPAERLNKEVRRWTDAVEVFPNQAAIVRLVCEVLAEQTDEWVEGRRYLGLKVLTCCQLTTVGDAGSDVTPISSFFNVVRCWWQISTQACCSSTRLRSARHSHRMRSRL